MATKKRQPKKQVAKKEPSDRKDKLDYRKVGQQLTAAFVLGGLLGTWKHYYKGSVSYTVTNYTFSSDGTYTMYKEMSMFFVSPLGSTTNMSTSTDRGTFRILDSGEVELVSNVVGRPVKRGKLMGGTLSLDYQQYYR